MISKHSRTATTLENPVLNASWMWSLQTHEHIKHFLWLTHHKIIPTNAFCVCQHVTIDSFFVAGEFHEESIQLIYDFKYHCINFGKLH